jgi:transcriptional antiterminator NusG
VAVPVAVVTPIDARADLPARLSPDVAPRFWHALWTSPRREQPVHDHLQARGFEPFLPRIEIWSRRDAERRSISAPLFPGYLFLRHPIMTRASYAEISSTRGLLHVLGEGWDRLTVVPACEVDGLRRVLEARLPLTPHPYVGDGEHVRIVSGPLADVEGTLVRTKPNRGLLVLSVALLQRSIAVEVDCTLVAAA